MKPVENLLFGNRYRLVSRIAVGGMGEVWRAHDNALNRDVAVKVLREEFAGDEGFIERFRAEARNSAALSHPNIASLYDYGEEGGSAYLVMELVLGEPLSDLLDREPVLPARRLLPLLAQTARALHAAHVAGVVHRDVKPQNILVDRSDRVRITDFGISTAINQVPLTDAGMVMGTAQYLSPEQAMGGAATPASDIYSLGIVAYEALAGHRPYTGATAVEIAVAHVSTPMPPLSSEVDPALAALVRKMLSKSATGRPRSAAAVAQRLDELAEQSAAAAFTGGRSYRAVDVFDAGASTTPPRSGQIPVTPVAAFEPGTTPPLPTADPAPSGPVTPVAPAPAPPVAVSIPITPAPVTSWDADGRPALPPAAPLVVPVAPAEPVEAARASERRPRREPARRAPGGLSWWGVAVAIVVIALLGAWFASWLVAAFRTAGPVFPGSAPIVTIACTEYPPTSGMIWPDPGATRPGTTPSARDQ